MARTGEFDSRLLHTCVADAIAMVTSAKHDPRDQALLVEALGIVKMRDTERFSAWLIRLAHLIVAETALLHGMLDTLADHTDTDATQVLRGIAIRYAALEEGDGQ
jgi:hypothetical protein